MPRAALDEKLADLRLALIGETGHRPQLSALAAQFMDVAEDTALLDSSAPSEEPLVRAILEAAVRQFTGRAELDLGEAPCYRYPPAGFLHGTFRAGERIGTYFWFESVGQGVVGLIGRDLRSTDYLHVSATVLPAGTNVVPGSETPQ